MQYIYNLTVAYSAERSKAVVPVLVLLFVALWFILRGDLSYVLTWCYFVLVFSVLLALRIPRLGKRELVLMLFVRLFDLCLFGFIGFLLVSAKSCGLWLSHSLDFSLTFFFIQCLLSVILAFQRKLCIGIIYLLGWRYILFCNQYLY